jgi:glutamine synthetase
MSDITIERGAAKASATARQRVEEFFSANEIHTVELAFADIQGVARGKRIPVRHFLKTLDRGIPFCKAVLGWDIACDVFPGIEFASFDNGYPDLVARADASTLKVLPWKPGVAWVIADLFTEHGDVVQAAPRNVLKNVINRAEEHAVLPKVGPELEFYLLGEDLKPLYEGIQCYSTPHAAIFADVLDEITISLEAAGVEVEAAGTEYGPAQIEINLAYTDALTAADNTLYFKNAVREIARKHGYVATFMAKPWEGESGNSFHLHQSLWSLDGETNLFDADEALGKRYLAGLQATARELQAIVAPTVNSYKRFVEQSFAPVNVTWGFDNRTAATRSLLGEGFASRIEQRTGSADANPYLVTAANIAAGLYGIDGELVLGGSTGNDAYAATDAQPLPSTLREALDALEASTVARAAFGDTFTAAFLAIGRHEVAVWERAVTQWERDRYLRLV